MNITALFGTGATLDTTTESDPVLQIPFSAIAAASAWDVPPTSGTDSAEKWLTAIFLHAKTHLATITNESNAITIDDPFPTIATRNDVQKIGYSYNMTIYQADQNPDAPDPDDV